MNVIHFGDIKDNKINPNKLKEARVARGLSRAKLSKKIGVSSQALYQYEKGKCKPSFNILLRIIDELDFPISFFNLKEINKWECRDIVYFRSNKNITNTLKEECMVRIKWVERCYYMIKEYLTVPQLNIPVIQNKCLEELDTLEIEKIANEIRCYWGLGNGPVGNLVSLLQKNGFVISRLELGTKKVDAFSVWKNDVPYIFLGSDKNSAVRSRFDLIHELGHLILHRNIDEDEFEVNRDILEKQADSFAAAFLLPRDSINNEVISSSIDSFILLKRKWKVSISAMIKRIQDIEMLTDNQIRYLKSQMIKHHYYQREPLDDQIKFEKPYLFKQAFQVMVDNNIMTKDMILEQLVLNKNEAISLYSLDEKFFELDEPICKVIKI